MTRPDMPTASVGRSGLDVSRRALGTMTFGVETDQTEAFAQLDLFQEHGGTLLDTADVYGAGESERIVGRWLTDRRPAETIGAIKRRFAPPPGWSNVTGWRLATIATTARLGGHVMPSAGIRLGPAVVIDLKGRGRRT